MDQRTEMARHDLLAALSDGIYFAEPASPSQQGTNEIEVASFERERLLRG